MHTKITENTRLSYHISMNHQLLLQKFSLDLRLYFDNSLC